MTEQAEFAGLPSVVESSASKAPRVGRRRLLSPNRMQVEWTAVELDSLLRADDPARMIWAYIEKMDLSEYTEAVQAVEGAPGHPAIDPRILLGLWMLAITDGVASARRLERLSREHIAYRWMCGGVTVNYHTLSDFRGQGEKLDRLFTGSLATLMAEGLVDLEQVSQDGLRVRASAGAASFRGRETLEQYVAQAEAQVERLKQQGEEEGQAPTKAEKKARERAAKERLERVQKALELLPEAEATMERRGKGREEARTSTTDPEARVMKMADGGFRPAFNLQASCDKRGMITGVEVSSIGSDMAQLEGMLDQVKERSGRYPKRAVCDGGYSSGGSIKSAKERGVDLYSPVQKPKKEDQDRYEPRPRDTPEQSEWRERMATDEAKQIYKQRGSSVEWVNANFRRYGLTQLLVRGRAKVRSVLLLIALTHNLLRGQALRREKPAAAQAA